MKRKEDYDRKIPTDHGIQDQGLVLLYDNRHKEFRVSYTLVGWVLTGYVKSFLTDPYN
jgi:hypothetical protein